MPVKALCYWPSKELREPTMAVEGFGQETQELCQDLYDSMIFYGGAGIAAPQIGIAKKIFIISGQVAQFASAGIQDSGVFINPEIIFSGTEQKKDIEGCLSFPGIFLHIERPVEIKIRAQDLVGKVFEVEARDFFSRALQHEYDHLSGKLMVDFVSHMKKEMIKKKLKKRGVR